MQPISTITTSDFESALNSMLAAAQAAGESFLDVASGPLNRQVSGTNGSSSGMTICCRLMRRMMIPGDSELSSSRGGYRATLLIRYALPR